MQAAGFGGICGRVWWNLESRIKDKLRLHPGRLTWNKIMEAWKIIFPSKWVICRFHVNLPGCKLKDKMA